MTASWSAEGWRKTGAVLLAFYLLAGMFYSALTPAAAHYPDEREYLALSGNLLHGPGFSMDGGHLTASRAPGYPFFIAAIQAVGGGIGAVRIAQFVLTACVVLLVARIVAAQDPRGPDAVLVTTLVVMAYPLFFYTSGTLYPQTLAAFLFVLALALLLRRGHRWPGDVAGGLVFGYLILVVPTFLLTLVVVLMVAGVLRIIRWRQAGIVLVAAGFIVCVWTARNFEVFHQFVPVASNSGANFLIGNCENTSPTGGSGNVDRTHYEQEARARGLDEFQTDRYYRDAALKWIETHPGRAFMLYLEKTANFFDVYNQYAPESRGEVTPWKQALVGATYALLLALLLWRLAEWRRFPLTKQEIFLLAVYVLSAFTSAIFFTRIRLRLPYDYLIVAIVAAHLQRRLVPWLVAGRTPSGTGTI